VAQDIMIQIHNQAVRAVAEAAHRLTHTEQAAAAALEVLAEIQTDQLGITIMLQLTEVLLDKVTLVETDITSQAALAAQADREHLVQLVADR
jgi:hypothetical protein